MTVKAVFFPHNVTEFRIPEELRSWLATDLKESGGYYKLHNAPGLGHLEKGSVVFFRRDRVVVGMAVVEEDLRPINPEENVELIKYEQIVKFFPNSIWAFSSNNCVSLEEFDKISKWGKISPDFAYSEINTLDQLKILLSLINH